MAAVVGREPELEALRTFLDAEGPGAGARVVVVEGEAGIGKTTLWRAAVQHAESRSDVVLSCQAAAGETQLAFTGLRDLIDDAYDVVEAELPEPQRHALAVTLLREEPSAHPIEPSAIGVAALGTLRLLARHVRVVVAVDDAQFLDAASAAALRYALRRAAGENVLAIIARRSDELDPLELDRLPAGHTTHVRVGGLSVGALGRVLHERLGRAFARPLLVRLHDVSAGNPFYALEIARAIPSTTAVPTLPMPRSLRQLVDERLDALPNDTVEALALVAACGRATTQLLREALGVDAAGLLEPALAAAVLELHGAEIRFAHPLFGAAVYDRSALRRGALHARLAEVVDDPEQRARHLALAGEDPSEEIAALVAHGAELAFSRGSPAAAAELAAAAVRLTPREAEGAATRRSLAEADFHFAAGNTARASELLDELLEHAAPGPERARLLSRQGRLRHFQRDIGASVSLLYAALAEAGDDDRGEIEEGLAWGLLLSRRDLSAAAEHARSAVQHADARGDPSALAEALAAQAVTDFVLGRPWGGTMSRALKLEHATANLRVLRQPSFAYGYVLSCADDLDAAREVFEQLRARTEQAGDESSVPSLLNHLALVECLAGRWAIAEQLFEDCRDRALESGQEPTHTSIQGKGALLAARRGDVELARARALGALGSDFDPASPAELMERGGETATWALGSLELHLGRPDEAHRLLGPMTAALVAAGVRDPGELRCLPDEIEALVLLGRLDEAAALVEHLRAWSERLDRSSVAATLGRCTGLLDAARGDNPAALEQLERASVLAAAAPLPFEQARTLLALGAQHRRVRQRRAARATLLEALAIFEGLGAALMIAATRTELSRIGGRVAAGDDLTARERHIAELVADGKKNKEVAAELVVTERTVESALTQIYRKLEVRSRTELARKLNAHD
jgi:DNA-binding CsgD family transcriptional regulator